MLLLLLRAGRTASSVATAEVWRRIPCEHCGEEYFFSLQLRAVGWVHEELRLTPSEWAKNAAQRDAAAKLRWLAENKIETVPCPSCGRYQPNMYAAVRHRRYHGLQVAWAILFATALSVGTLAFLILVDPDGDFKGSPAKPYMIPLTAAFVLATWVLHKVRKWLSARYDPNNESEADERMVLAQDRAFTGKDLQARGFDLQEFQEKPT